MSIEQDQVVEPNERTMRRAVAGAVLGNAVEWFDYGIYGAQRLLVFAGVAIRSCCDRSAGTSSARSATSSADAGCSP